MTIFLLLTPPPSLSASFSLPPSFYLATPHTPFVIFLSFPPPPPPPWLPRERQRRPAVRGLDPDRFLVFFTQSHRLMQKHFTKLSKNVCPEHFSSPIDFYCKQRVALDRVGSAGRACRRLFRYDFCFFFKFFFSPSLISLQRLVSRHPRFLLPRTSVATPGISPGAAAAGAGRDPGGPGPPVPRGLLRRRDRLGCPVVSK